MTTRLTRHFTLEEMTTTQVRDVSNVPDAQQRANLLRLCETAMEPVRAKFGPIHVNSGFRSAAVNARIGGSKTSAHMQGLACDFVPLRKGVTLRQICDWVISSGAVPYDQVIYEFGRWVHLGLAADGKAPRKQALMIFAAGVYRPYDPTVIG